MKRGLVALAMIVAVVTPAAAEEPKKKNDLADAFPPCTDDGPCEVKDYGAYILLTDIAALAMMAWFVHHESQPPPPCCEECACDDMSGLVPLFAGVLYGGVGPGLHHMVGKKKTAWLSAGLRAALPLGAWAAARAIDGPLHPGTATVLGALAAIAIDVTLLARVRVAVQPAERGDGGAVGLAGCF